MIYQIISPHKWHQLGFVLFILSILTLIRDPGPRTHVPVNDNAPICDLSAFLEIFCKCDLPDNLAANGIHTIRFYMH